MINRRISAIITTALLLLFTSTFSLAASREISVGIYENAPKVFTDEKGKPAGIFIDIIEYIAEQEGWSLNYVHGTWGEGSIGSGAAKST